MTTLYLFAHQDDEIGVFHSIASGIARGEPAICAFLTDGAFAGVTADTRNRESLAVLTALGVPRQDIVFVGQAAGISDGKLVEHLAPALSALTALVGARGPVERIVMHAWEGGHHDHDATHLIGRRLARDLGIADVSRQFALYRAGPAGRIRFADPDPAQGEIEALAIPYASRGRYLLLLRNYRSQLRVMMQLGPRLLSTYLRDGREKLQRLPPPHVLLTPPADELLYQRWKLYTYARFEQHAAPFVRAGKLAE